MCVHVCEKMLRDANWIGGLTKVAIYPMCAHLLRKIAVLATPIQGLRDIGWQVTQLTCKQLKQTTQGTKITLGTYSWINEEHFPVKL